jgi:NAD(P)-dependent dehydrogenase (short-subunit alcohol dehydrogenase family)
MVVGSGSRRVRWLCLRQATFSAKPPPPSQNSADPAYTTFDNNSELAAAYVMLASDEASYISGATIAVTGGAPII